MVKEPMGSGAPPAKVDDGTTTPRAWGLEVLEVKPMGGGERGGREVQGGAAAMVSGSEAAAGGR